LEAKSYWNKDDMETTGMYNDDLSSLMVPFGLTVELYEDSGWTGSSRIYQGEMFAEYD